MHSDRRYLIKENKISFGYYDESRQCFYMQVDIIGLGSDEAVLVTDVAGSKLLATNPDITCEIPFLCWCEQDIIPLLESSGFTPLSEKED